MATSVYLLGVSNQKNHYDLPLERNFLLYVIEEIYPGWDIIQENSIDDSNRNFFLSNPEQKYKIYVSSMNKDKMKSLATMIHYTLGNESLVLDSSAHKQLFHFTCQLAGVKNYSSIYKKMDSYLTKRDSQIYGETIWYHGNEDKIISVKWKESSVDKGKYQIVSIFVENPAFFKKIKQISTNYNTEKYKNNPNLNVSVYEDIPLNEVKNRVSKDNNISSRILVTGKLIDVRKPKVDELSKLALEDMAPILYADDYSLAHISDDKGILPLLIPRYFTDLSLLGSEVKEWHITYHAPADIYIVDYGIDI